MTLAAPLLAACLAGPGSTVPAPPYYPPPFSWRAGCGGHCVVLEVDAGAGRGHVESFSWPAEAARAYADGSLERRARAAWRDRGPRKTFPAATFRRFMDASLEQWGVRP
jgi:hypothetical protein